MTSLKRHFLKNVSTDFSDFFLADVKLMLEKVMKVLRRYLLLFLSYRENPAGGQNLTPPPAGCGLSYKHLLRTLGIPYSFLRTFVNNLLLTNFWHTILCPIRSVSYEHVLTKMWHTIFFFTNFCLRSVVVRSFALYDHLLTNSNLRTLGIRIFGI